METIDLSRTYEFRFRAIGEDRRKDVWKILCSDFFQQWIPANANVLDIGAGTCLFVNNIAAQEKWALDVFESIREFANPDVNIAIGDVLNPTAMPENKFDLCFVSNFLEHMPTRMDVIRACMSAFRWLKPGGKLLILQPNVRYVGFEYWDFIDHFIPLTEKSLAEALVQAGFEIERLEPRFLPYSFTGRLPSWPILVKIFVRMPILWKIFGKQAFVVARKPQVVLDQQMSTHI